VSPVPIGGTKFYSIEEVAELFPEKHRPSLETIRRYIRLKVLAGRKVGGAWYCSERSVQVFLEGRPAEPAVNPDAADVGLPGPL
jgi:hypothetical protein